MKQWRTAKQQSAELMSNWQKTYKQSKQLTGVGMTTNEPRLSWKHSASKNEKASDNHCVCGGYLWLISGERVCGDCGRTY